MINADTAYTIPFVTMAAGVPTAADSTPTAVVWRNGSAEATSVTVSTTSNTGIYHAAFTTGAGWAKTDRIWLVVSATISGTAYKGIAWDSFSESGSSTVTVLPASGIAAGRGETTSLVAYVGETISQSIGVYQADGTTPYDLSGKTLTIIFENLKTGDDVAVVASGSITISGASNNTVTFSYPSAATTSQRELGWVLRDESAPKTVYLRGTLEVRYAPTVG